MKPFAVALLSLSCLAASRLVAQDERTVTEPKIPPSCATLDAKLVSMGSTLAAEDESKLDTDRIQKAIDSCGPKHGVELRASGSMNAFVSGPLTLRQGVTIVVDKGVTLFESLDPKVLETSPGSCGLVSQTRDRGCKPLISVENISGAGVMGDGVID